MKTAKNDAIEKGIYLTPNDKRVHACKIREDLGCGLTRCGQKFLIGNNLYCPGAVFGAPAKEGTTGEFKICKICESKIEYNAKVWKDWKSVLKRTLQMIGHVS